MTNQIFPPAEQLKTQFYFFFSPLLASNQFSIHLNPSKKSHLVRNRVPNNFQHYLLLSGPLLKQHKLSGRSRPKLLHRVKVVRTYVRTYVLTYRSKQLWPNATKSSSGCSVSQLRAVMVQVFYKLLKEKRSLPNCAASHRSLTS